MNSSNNFCCNCKHLLGKRHDIGNADNWRCFHPNNVESRRFNLITGIPITVYKTENLREIRDNLFLCGPDGIWFEQYIPPVYTPPPPAPATIKAETKAISPSLKARLGALKAEDL